jgi:hypothetical protein
MLMQAPPMASMSGMSGDPPVTGSAEDDGVDDAVGRPGLVGADCEQAVEKFEAVVPGIVHSGLVVGEPGCGTVVDGVVDAVGEVDVEAATLDGGVETFDVDVVEESVDGGVSLVAVEVAVTAEVDVGANVNGVVVETKLDVGTVVDGDVVVSLIVVVVHVPSTAPGWASRNW